MMNLRIQKPTITTDSNSTMKDSLPKPALLLKSCLEEALKASHTHDSTILPYTFKSPTFDQAFLTNLDRAQARISNILLHQYFALGLNNREPAVPSALPLRYTRIANFLAAYFSEEPEALSHLCHVSLNEIARISDKNLATIIRLKTPKPYRFLHPSPASEAPASPQPLNIYPVILGQDKNSPGEMWQSAPNSPYSPPYSPNFDVDQYQDYCRNLEPPFYPEVFPEDLPRSNKRRRLSDPLISGL